MPHQTELIFSGCLLEVEYYQCDVERLNNNGQFLGNMNINVRIFYGNMEVQRAFILKCHIRMS